MGLIKQTSPNTQRSHARMRTLLTQAAQNGKSYAVIVSTYEEVMQLKKQWAGEDFSFGMTVSSLPSWLQDRWELFGDGRRILSSLERKLFMDEAVRQAHKKKLVNELAHTPGTVKLLADMAREDLSWLLGDTRIEESAGELTSAESETLKILGLYADLLDAQKKCELVQAMNILGKSGDPNSVIIVEDRGEFTRAERAFFSEIAQFTDVHIIVDEISLPAKSPDRAQELIDLQLSLFEPDQGNPVIPSGAVRFLLPAGNYATSLLVAQSIVEAVKAGDTRIAVSTKDPEGLFVRIADYGMAYGLRISFSTTKRFVESDFGSMWINLLDFLLNAHCTSFQVSDVLFSPFSDVSKKKVYEFDLLWRADRTLGKEDYLRNLSSASPLFAYVIEAIKAKKWSDVLDAFEAAVKDKFSWTKAYRAEQQKAITIARAFFGIIDDFKGDPIESLTQLAEHNLALSVSAGGEAPSSPRVDIMGLDALADIEACSYDTVILCDLDAASYPLRDAQDAKTRLFAKLGNNSPLNASTRMRNQFFRVLSVPKRQLICERILNTYEANKSYPAVMLEELFDCYRYDLLRIDELDRLSGMPKVLLPFTERAGEDRLFRNSAVLDKDQDIDSSIESCSRGIIHEESKEKIILSHLGKMRNGSDKLLLSPSAIESYLECPYKWFTLRRLRLEGVDAGFGPLEMGIFSHELLKDFYQQFQEEGNARVLVENLPRAKNLLSELFDEHIAKQEVIKYKNRPLLAISKLEEAEIASLKKSLIKHLDREALFLPGFIPRYFEQNFGRERGFEFAGSFLHGTVDRIDVNEKGQAVVIDYKGSVDSEYAFGTMSEVPWIPTSLDEKELVLPNKVQTLLYAQAARKELGLEVIGGLYISYGRDAVAGAYDPHILGPAEIPGIKADINEARSENGSDFSMMLDDFEARLQRALNCLKSGYIRPNPRGKDPCGFCPVTSCEKRR